MDDLKKLCVLLMLMCLSGCLIKDGLPKGTKDMPNDRASVFEQIPADQQRYEDILAALANNEKRPNYPEVKSALEGFILEHPQSKWAPSARVLILSLDKIIALEHRLALEKQKALSGEAKSTRELQAAKESLRQLEEKYVFDMAKLLQENEQLKNDLQQLKQLEVQMEKREKMLR